MNRYTLNARPSLLAVPPMARLGRIKRSYVMATGPAPTGASNDPTYLRAQESESTRRSTDELEAWARRAAAASGFGEAAAGTPVERSAPDSMKLAVAARVHRSAALPDVVAAVIAALSAAARRRLAAWQRARDELATARALRGLDQRTLRDIGLDASEARSVAAELAGGTERTRIHALMTLRNLAI